MADPNIPASVKKMQDRLLWKAVLFMLAVISIFIAATLVWVPLGLVVLGLTLGYVAAKL